MFIRIISGLNSRLFEISNLKRRIQLTSSRLDLRLIAKFGDEELQIITKNG